MSSDPMTWQRNDTPKKVYNPLTKDLKMKYRDDSNAEHDLVIPFYTTVTLPTWLADVVIVQLVDFLINERDLGIMTPEKRKELEAEVTG